MHTKFLSAFSVVKENFAYLLVIFGLFLVLTVGGYWAISRSFENRLQTEVSIVFDIAKSQIESNFQNFEMGIYEDVFRIQNAFDELQDSARIKSLIRRSTYKRISFITYDDENNIKLDEIDTMCIYGIFKGETFTTTKSPLNLEGIKAQNWYKKAKAANGALVKNPLHKAILLGYKDAVSWSKEFFDKDGNSIAVLNFAIPYESYMKIFKAISHFRGGYVFLTDNSNVMLEHPNSEFIGKHILQINQNWKAFVSGNDMSVKDIPNFENVKTYAYKNTVLDDQFMYVVVPLDNYYRDLRFAEVKLVVLCFFCYLILSIILVKLNERKKKADNDNKAKSGFLAVMSHEIRTPLNAIVGLSQLEMEKSTVPSAVKQTFEKILISSKNLLSIINDILDLSKIENEKLKITEDEYDIPSLLNDVLVMSQARIASKPIELKLNISPNIPGRLSGDTLRIKQVLNNFISNAIKYTEKGSVELTVSAEGSSSPNLTNIKFVVKDTGVGIKAEKIQELFTEYNRLDTKKNLTIEGTGLGLAITKKLSDLMGGTIEVKSKVDSGSEFSFEVPQKIIDSNPIGESVAQNLEKFKYSAENIIANKNMIREKLSGTSILVFVGVAVTIHISMLGKWRKK
ncbi:hypothetical protein AGMMS49938_05580 [Fibrobacterales bacterium]|nr:hypothetical protein AGMMS49938_05580 [Fibrobacterales bacterium]